jgi:hypothetical protein
MAVLSPEIRSLPSDRPNKPGRGSAKNCRIPRHRSPRMITAAKLIDRMPEDADDGLEVFCRTLR